MSILCYGICRRRWRPRQRSLLFPAFLTGAFLHIEEVVELTHSLFPLFSAFLSLGGSSQSKCKPLIWHLMTEASSSSDHKPLSESNTETWKPMDNDPATVITTRTPSLQTAAPSSSFDIYDGEEPHHCQQDTMRRTQTQATQTHSICKARIISFMMMMCLAITSLDDDDQCKGLMLFPAFHCPLTHWWRHCLSLHRRSGPFGERFDV
jgi:hypothetical protein